MPRRGLLTLRQIQSPVFKELVVSRNPGATEIASSLMNRRILCCATIVNFRFDGIHCLQVLVDTLALSGRIKKTPVVVGNCTGFAVNRVFFPYTMAACMLVDMGMNPYAVDKVIAGVYLLLLENLHERC